jgi:hypothetical protein
MPGRSVLSGCPGVRDPALQWLCRSSIATSYPVRCSSEYCRMHAWPGERTNRSRFSHAGLRGLWRRNCENETHGE